MDRMVLAKILQRKNLKIVSFISILVLVLLIPTLLVILLRPNKSLAAWFNDSWLYRKSLTFTHNAALTNQKVKFDIDTATLITNGQMQSDCGDSRFTDSNGNLLPYYLDPSAGGANVCNQNSTDYYVLIPVVNNNIPTVIYHYYGNPTTPNGTSTSQLPYPTLSPSGGAATLGSEEQGPGPILNWKLDDKSGSTAYDSSATQNNGSVLNNATFTGDDNCISSGCAYFPGGTSSSGDAISTSSLTSLSKQTTGTISFWAKPVAANSNQAMFSLFRTADTTGTGINIYYDNSTSGGSNIYAEAFKDGGAQKWVFSVSTSTFNSITETNKWHFYTLTHNGTTPAFYIDGKSVPISFSISTDKTVWFKAVLTDATSKADNLRIGNIYPNNTVATPYTGNIDELKIYPYVRSASQISADYIARGGNKGIAASFGGSQQQLLSDGLIGYWKLDSALTDSSGNANTLTANGGTYAGGKYGRGMSLTSGSAEFLYTSDSANLSITGDITISTWIKPSAVTTSTRFPIAGKSDSSGISYLLEQYGSELRMYVGSSSNYVTSSGANLAIGTWYNIIAVFSAKDRSIALYLNGQALSTTVSGTIPSSISDGSDNFNIGTDISSGTTLNLQVASSNDDGADVASETNTFHTLGNCDDGWTGTGVLTTGGKCPSASAITAGYRFTNVTVPQGNTIYSATFDLYNKYGGGYNTDVKNRIYGSKLSNLSIFSGTNVPRNVTKTTAYADWNSTGVSTTANTWFSQTSNPPPAVTSIIQEIVNQGSWSSGNALGLIFTDNGSTNDWWFEVNPYDGTPANAAKLVISYGSVAANYYSGTIDEVKIYNKAVSPEDVSNLYNSSPGPVGYWQFDEASTTTANDSSGNDLNLSYSGNYKKSIGKIGNAIEFLDRVDNYAGLADDDSLDIYANQSFTVGAWIYSSAANDASELAVIASKLACCGAAGWSLYRDHTTNLGYFVMTDGTHSISYSTTAVIPRERWTHIEAVLDQRNQVRLYLNGILDSTQNASLSTVNGVENSTNLGIGVADPPSGNYNEFQGKIDDVRIYNYARTPSQVIEDFNGSHPIGGSPIGSQFIYTKFDEQNGTTMNNSGFGGSSYNGTSTGTTWLDNTRCKTNGCLNFDTTTDTVSFGDVSFIDNIASMSASFWINPQQLATNKMILSKANTATQRVFQLKTNDSACTSGSCELKVMISSGVASDTSNYCVTSGFGLSVNSWQHVTFVYDGFQPAANRIQMFKNGKPITCTVTGSIPNTMLSGTTSLLKLGQGDDSTPTSLIMFLDEFKIYNAALTQDTILIDYNQGSAVNFNTGSAVEASQSGDTAGSAPIAYWPMDENTGTTLKDLSGNGTNGTITGAKYAVGKIGSALNFQNNANQSQSVLLATDGMFDSLSSLTIETWFKLRTTGGDTSHDIFNIDQSGVGTVWWQIQALPATSEIAVTMSSCSSGRFEFKIPISGNILDWHHVALTIQSSVGNKIYLDGQRVIPASYTQGSANSDCAMSKWTPISGTNRYTLGCWLGGNASCDTSELYEGWLDEFKIYNYARTAAQIVYDYNRGAPVGWWKFDECQGSTLYDSSGNANHGTWSGSGGGSNTAVGTCSDGNSAHSWYNGATGKFNSAFSFDGTDDYAEKTSSTNLPSGATPRTISAWVKTDGSIAYEYVVSYGDRSTGNWTGLAIENTGKIYFDTWANDTPGTAVTTINNNNWHFIAAAYNGNTSVDFYFDGKFLETDSIASPANTTGSTLRIGNSSENNYYFKGLIDDLRIYNYSLSLSQIQKVYNNGASVFFGPATGSP